MKIKIYISILITLLISLSIIIVFNERMGKKYIYLEECYRVAEECVIFDTKNRPRYLVFKNCSIPPRNIEINKYIFVEK